jgi:hypothetical protein
MGIAQSRQNDIFVSSIAKLTENGLTELANKQICEILNSIMKEMEPNINQYTMNPVSKYHKAVVANLREILKRNYLDTVSQSLDGSVVNIFNDIMENKILKQIEIAYNEHENDFNEEFKKRKIQCEKFLFELLNESFITSELCDISKSLDKQPYWKKYFDHWSVFWNDTITEKSNYKKYFSLDFLIQVNDNDPKQIDVSYRKIFDEEHDGGKVDGYNSDIKYKEQIVDYLLSDIVKNLYQNIMIELINDELLKDRSSDKLYQLIEMHNYIEFYELNVRAFKNTKLFNGLDKVIYINAGKKENTLSEFINKNFTNVDSRFIPEKIEELFANDSITLPNLIIVSFDFKKSISRGQKDFVVDKIWKHYIDQEF